MSLTKRGPVPRSSAARGWMLGASCSAILVGGCAHESPNSYSQNGSYAGGPRQQAAVVPVPVELEDDGKPAQLPPPTRERAERDDPREPWSPNYGGPAIQAAVKPTTPSRKIADAAD